MTTRNRWDETRALYRYCPCDGETPDPCPACGATVAGNDPVRGVCRLPMPPLDYGIRIVLVHRDTGEIVT